MESHGELANASHFTSSMGERPQSRIMQVVMQANASQQQGATGSFSGKPPVSSSELAVNSGRNMLGRENMMLGSNERSSPFAYPGYSADAPAFVPSANYYGTSQSNAFSTTQSQQEAYLGGQSQQTASYLANQNQPVSAAYLDDAAFPGAAFSGAAYAGAQYDVALQGAPHFDANLADADTVPSAYTTAPSFIASRNGATKQQRLATSFYFSAEELRTELLNRSVAQTNGTVVGPSRVEYYRDLIVLEPLPGRKSALFGGLATTVYRCVSVRDGLTYAMRRIHNFRAANARALALVEAWRTLEHANLVAVRDVFTTQAFNDTSLCFVYDFFPSAETLFKLHFASTIGGSAAQQQGAANGDARPFSAARQTSSQSASAMRAKQAASASLSENVLWNYVLQLSSVIRAVHQLNLACRVLDATKILVTSRSRLRLNGVGILDVVSLGAAPAGNLDALIKQYQQEDLLTFGHLLLALACNSIAPQRDPARLDQLLRNYSQDFRNVVFYLTGGPTKRGGGAKSIHDIMPLIGARFYTHLEASMLRGDILENELSKELENGRLYRLLCKLNAIVERAEFAADPSWSETGDRYMLKLFRDYAFHQSGERGEPFLDLIHMTQTLNKLDSRSAERICLVSRDQLSVVVISYAELRACLDAAFEELASAAAQGQPLALAGATAVSADVDLGSGAAHEVAYPGLVQNFGAMSMMPDSSYYPYAYDSSQNVAAANFKPAGSDSTPSAAGEPSSNTNVASGSLIPK